MQTCTTCNVPKTVDNFYYNRVNKRLFVECKLCNTLRTMAWKSRNRDKVKKSHAKSRAKLTKKAMESIGKANFGFREVLIKEANFSCSACSFTRQNDYRFFDVDHIVPVRDSNKKSRTVTPAERHNLQVLCPNCHRIKTIKNKDFLNKIHLTKQNPRH